MYSLQTNREHQRVDSLFEIFRASFAHIGVSMGIVAVNSFLNSELRFHGWKPSLISFFLGTVILFELSRIVVGKKFDHSRNVKAPFVASLILMFIGIAFVPFFIEPIGNIGIIIVLALFFIGSAITSTLIDSVLTMISETGNRIKVAGVLQTLRLSGFAIGGIVGAILYPILHFFWFCLIIGLLCAITILISIYQIIQFENKGLLANIEPSKSNNRSMKELLQIIKLPRPFLMSLFLIIYPLGLFMQDLILETYTIDAFGYSENGVGKVVVVWSTLTLLFVPVGVKLEKKVSRRMLSFTGSAIGSLGLILIASSSYDFSMREAIFFLGLVLFGIGNGLLSAPVIALMLDISAEQVSFTAMLLGFYGVILTIGRFNAAWITGVVLVLTGENYAIVFIIEAIFLLLTWVPIHFLTINENYKTSRNISPVFADY